VEWPTQSWEKETKSDLQFHKTGPVSDWRLARQMLLHSLAVKESLSKSVLLVADFSNQLRTVRILEVGNVRVDLLELFDSNAHSEWVS